MLDLLGADQRPSERAEHFKDDLLRLVADDLVRFHLAFAEAFRQRVPVCANSSNSRTQIRKQEKSSPLTGNLLSGVTEGEQVIVDG